MPDLMPIVTPDRVSPSWLTAVLDSRGIDAVVESVEVEPVGTGQLAETRRFRLAYKDTPDGRAPRSLVGKFTSESPVSAETGHSLGIYRSEVMFYRHLSPRAKIRTPEVYLAEIDDRGHFVLLLEDLEPARPGDQMTGCTLEETRKALAEAALLHAAFWNDDSLTGHDWLYVPEGAQGFYTTELIEQSWAHVQETYDGWLPADVVEVCERYVRNHGEWNRPRTGPHCLTHNDFRPDNMMFGGTDGRIALVDWQTVSYLGAGMDVAYFLGGALDRDLRRSAEPDLLRGYHDDLVANGVSGYPFDELMNDYRHYTYAALAVALAATVIVKRTERGDRMLMRMIQDGAYHVLDAGALDVLGG